MKSFITIASLALLAVVFANPTPSGSNTITYQDQFGNIVTEDLDKPAAITYAVTTDDLKFMLYTASNKDTPYELESGNAALLKKSKFDASKNTKVVIHGWQNNYNSESVQIIKDAYLAHSSVNVILVDYSPVNSPYLTAVSSAEKVGEHVATFINFLLAQGLALSKVHIIGHSLGAHISGFCAQAVNGKVPRVTGLDAAGPMFNDKAAKGRLSSDDATYVECLHTSTAFGMTNRCGTADFYPNGGDSQPACAQASVPGGCDHSAAYRYWAESIANKSKFPARTCKSESDAQDNNKAPTACAASSAVMGEDAINKTPAGVYYVGV